MSTMGDEEIREAAGKRTHVVLNNQAFLLYILYPSALNQ